MRVFQYYSCRLSKKRESTFECRLRKYIIKFIRFCKINILLFLFSLRSRRTESRARSTNRNLLRSQTRWDLASTRPSSLATHIPARTGSYREIRWRPDETRWLEDNSSPSVRLKFSRQHSYSGKWQFFCVRFCTAYFVKQMFAIYFVCNIFYNN